jgi:3-oxosteroid 1-dehydrogenase
MGMAAGAALGNMSEAWWAPAMAVSGATIDGAPLYRMLFMDCAKPGGMLVDGRGRRFVDEGANYNDLGRALLAFDAGAYAYPGVPSWLILDAARDRPARGSGPRPRLARARRNARGPRRPGRPAGCAAGAVGRAVQRVRRRRPRRGLRPRRLRVGRVSAGSAELAPIEGPPFYALRVLPGCLGTKGGLRIDAGGRVRHIEDGSPIAGLHAAGNAAANPFGCAYPGPGATIGAALVFGWRAGETAAAAAA